MCHKKITQMHVIFILYLGLQWHTFVSVMKSKIRDRINIPHEEQELFFNEMVLDNMSTVDDFTWTKNPHLHFVHVLTEYMRISIKTLANKTIINNVKLMIHDKVCILPHHHIVLTFKGSQPDDHTLADYNTCDYNPQLYFKTNGWNIEGFRLE